MPFLIGGMICLVHPMDAHFAVSSRGAWPFLVGGMIAFCRQQPWRMAVLSWWNDCVLPSAAVNQDVIEEIVELFGRSLFYPCQAPLSGLAGEVGSCTSQQFKLL